MYIWIQDTPKGFSWGTQTLKLKFITFWEFKIYLMEVSSCVICNIFFKWFLITSMICLPCSKEIKWGSGASNFHYNPITSSQPLCSLINQVCISLSWIQRPKQYYTLLFYTYMQPYVSKLSCYLKTNHLQQKPIVKSLKILKKPENHLKVHCPSLSEDLLHKLQHMFPESTWVVLHSCEPGSG